MAHRYLRKGSEPRNIDKQRVAVRAPFQIRIYVAGSRAYDEQINRPEFIEKGSDCSRGFFVFRKINAPDKCDGAASGSYLFQKVQPPGREGKTPALTAQLARESLAYSG